MNDLTLKMMRDVVDQLKSVKAEKGHEDTIVGVSRRDLEEIGGVDFSTIDLSKIGTKIFYTTPPYEQLELDLKEPCDD